MKCLDEMNAETDAYEELDELEDELAELASDIHEKCYHAFQEDNGDWMHTTTSAAFRQFMLLVECEFARIKLEEAQDKRFPIEKKIAERHAALVKCVVLHCGNWWERL